MATQQELDLSKINLTESVYDFDVWYAEAWSRKQGQFSFNLANTLIRFLKEKHKSIKSVLDVCSGSGEFVSVLRNICTDCMGVDNAEGYLRFVQSKINDVVFKKVDKLYDFNLKRKFDLISCNRDVVNMFTTFAKWETFFKTTFEHLNKGGMLMFDYYTKHKLEGWQETIFEQSAEIDYVSDVTQNNGLCVMSEVYYLKETSTLYRKTGDVMVEAWFENDEIVKALKLAGFREVKLVDSNLVEIPADKLAERNRIHILAYK